MAFDTETLLILAGIIFFFYSIHYWFVGRVRRFKRQMAQYKQELKDLTEGGVDNKE